MASTTQNLHFILIPLMGQGHMIPMIDFARLLAQRGVLVTIITTPLNAIRFKSVITHAVESKLQIRVIELYFPCVEAGLPEGCENFDNLPSLHYSDKFFAAASMLKEPIGQFLKQVEPPPSCLIADVSFPWATEVSHKFHIPRLVFNPCCLFSYLCLCNIIASKVLDDITSESDQFVVPGIPGQIQLIKSEFPKPLNSADKDNIDKIFSKDVDDEVFKEEGAATLAADGIVVNTFKELEADYVKEYEKLMGKKVWCVGPVSLCNKKQLDKAERGKKASVDEDHCLKWLDSWEPNSVIYVSFGSLSRLSTSQMIELGLGLEASNRPFIWVIGYKSDNLKNWITKEGFEERVRGRSLLIHGWAPQVLILSHKATGGFLTHCGWNSTIESISAGVPMITWPVFAEQFINEKLVVNVLRIGVMIGVKVHVIPGEEEKMDVLVKKDDVKNAVNWLMDDGEEGEERRERARELAEVANKAVQDGGSSQVYITQLIEEIANGRLYDFDLEK